MDPSGWNSSPAMLFVPADVTGETLTEVADKLIALSKH